ncbi:hypothetical protein BFC22_02030 [Carnobacterium divergens]|uniref:hypothetical protein n=1 Tax=Carnobacterium divergens TaxID=2748 RepID=UPI000E744D88|nr:hypothetical protein [Carnobacterium divergens]ANZ98951.1 hypothetical protein BFC22_02030 [Carnobacterium divergens]
MTEKNNNQEEQNELKNSEEMASEETTEKAEQVLIEKEEVVEASELEEEFEDDLEDFSDEELEEEPKSKLAKYMGPILYSLLGIMIVAALIFTYYVFPFFSKVSGEWTGSSASGTFKIVNKGKDSEFRFVDMNGTKGLDLIFESNLSRKGVNQYDVTNTKVKLSLSKKDISKENIEAMKKETKLVKVEKETAKEVILSYTKEGIKSSFGDTKLNDLFHYQLSDINWMLKGETLVLKNQVFANPLLDFQRK